MTSFDRTPEPQLSLSVAARTDPGRHRQVNEDALLAADPCFMVADGMGGHERGDIASRVAVATFRELFTSAGATTVQQVERALDQARERVRDVASGTRRGAGSTLAGVIRVVHEQVPCWYVLNIGDSRVYLLRGSELLQLTEDHSLRAELMAEGDSLGASTPSNIITRALGSDDDRHDAWLLPIAAASRVLVCSDGLSAEVSDEQLRRVLTAERDTGAAANECVRLALAAGGRDNITVVLIDVLEGEGESESEGEFGDSTLEITIPGNAHAAAREQSNGSSL